MLAVKGGNEENSFKQKAGDKTDSKSRLFKFAQLRFLIQRQIRGGRQTNADPTARCLLRDGRVMETVEEEEGATTVGDSQAACSHFISQTETLQAVF